MKRLLSHIYGAAVDLRNFAYDRGMLRTQRVEVPVISVGNISAGGTGKTPIVERLVAHFIELGQHPAVVTRGYRRATRGNLLVSDGRGAVTNARQGGDEAVQIARKFRNLVVIADEIRSRGCRRAAGEFSADVIILDDAYQHRGVHRDFDIVVIDATDELYAQRLLPEGRLREPLENLRRADVILLSKCEATTSVEQLREALAAYSHVPVHATRFLPRHLRRLGGDEALPLDSLRNSPLGSFCGIGNPDGFRRTLTDLHAEVKISRDYPDHFWYREEDLVELRKLGQESGVAAWITTEKDAVRLMDGELWRHLGDVYYPEMEVEFLGDEAGFFGMLDPYSARGRDVR